MPHGIRQPRLAIVGYTVESELRQVFKVVLYRRVGERSEVRISVAGVNKLHPADHERTGVLEQDGFGHSKVKSCREADICHDCFCAADVGGSQTHRSEAPSQQGNVSFDR